MAAETSGGCTALASPEQAVPELLCALFDAQARQRILEAWGAGWITADDAMELLFSLDLLEDVGLVDG